MSGKFQLVHSGFINKSKRGKIKRLKTKKVKYKIKDDDEIFFPINL